MFECLLLDNDIVLKVASWRLGNEMLAGTAFLGRQPAILGVAKYVVGNRLAKANYLVNRFAAKLAFDDLLTEMAAVEPTDEEIAYAAELELAAVAGGFEFDAGESQLLAILVRRHYDALLTGDKRAVRAMEQIAPSEAGGRVACLEQLIADIVERREVGFARQRVCSEPATDRAITICFSCSNHTPPTKKAVMSGLSSYCEDLRRDAATILLPGCDLSALAS